MCRMGEEDPLVLEGMDVPPPVFTASIVGGKGAQEKKLLHEALIVMAREDPSLHVVLEDVDTKQTLVSGMGELHLQITLVRLFQSMSGGLLLCRLTFVCDFFFLLVVCSLLVLCWFFGATTTLHRHTATTHCNDTLQRHTAPHCHRIEYNANTNCPMPRWGKCPCRFVKALPVANRWEKPRKIEWWGQNEGLPK